MPAVPTARVWTGWVVYPFGGNTAGQGSNRGLPLPAWRGVVWALDPTA
jgi:hypothetical protein